MQNKRYLFIGLLLLPLVLAAQGTWQQKTNFPSINGRNHGASFTINSKGYFGTGHNGLFQLDFWEYHPAADTWTQKADLTQKRFAAISFSISGKGYIGLGDNLSGILNDMEEYDPLLNTWTQKSSMPAAGRPHSVALVANNKAYIGTGSITSQNNYNDWWEYNPATDIWTQKSNLPFARESATAFAINNFGYVFGGADSIVLCNDLWEYNAISDTWSQKASMPDSARARSCSFVKGNIGYILVGDLGGNFYSNDVWQYNPSSNTWLSKPPLPADGRYASSAFELNGKGYIVGGVSNFAYLGELWEYTPDSVYAEVNELENTLMVTAYPNPCYNKLILNAPAQIPAEVFIYNVKGDEVYCTKNAVLRNFEINTAALSSGTYFVKVQSHGNCYTNKIIKM